MDLPELFKGTNIQDCICGGIFGMSLYYTSYLVRVKTIICTFLENSTNTYKKKNKKSENYMLEKFVYENKLCSRMYDRCIGNVGKIR